MAPGDRIAVCGWLMMGVPMRLPRLPTLVIVNVPPCSSSGWSFLDRVRTARSATVWARPVRFCWPALRTTGTSRPFVPSATAMPMW